MKATCRDHELTLMRGERCPYCAQGVAPLRTLRAIRDFAGVPMPGTVDVPAGVRTIRYSQVVREVGRELLALESERRARCADLDMRLLELRRRMKRVRVKPGEMHRAIRILMGHKDERAGLSAVARSYLQVVEDDGVDW